MRLRFWPFSEIESLERDKQLLVACLDQLRRVRDEATEKYMALAAEHLHLERRHADLCRVLNDDTKANEATIARLTAERDSLADNILAALTEES